VCVCVCVCESGLSVLVHLNALACVYVAPQWT